MNRLLEIRDLEIGFPGLQPSRAVRGVSFSIARGEAVGVVGESGAGKSLIALSVLGLVPAPGRVEAGSIRFDGVELTRIGERALRAVRGARIGLVVQEPAGALNPVLTVGGQLVEVLRTHLPLTAREARRRAVELLASLAIDRPGERLNQYPAELSGGERQRVLLAIALAGEPELLIADEPTAALDGVIADQVLSYLDRERRQRQCAILLVTHDFGSVARLCDRAVVVYCGLVVESAPVPVLLRGSVHPYTRALVGSVLRRGGEPGTRLPTIPGRAPAIHELPSGCSFHPRCPERRPPCAVEAPGWQDLDGGSHGVRCVLAEST